MKHCQLKAKNHIHNCESVTQTLKTHFSRSMSTSINAIFMFNNIKLKKKTGQAVLMSESSIENWRLETKITHRHTTEQRNYSVYTVNPWIEAPKSDPRLLLVQSSQNPACIRGPASISTIKSDPGLYSKPGLYSRIYGKWTMSIQFIAIISIYFSWFGKCVAPPNNL